jgi:hypothetical protein
MTRLLAALALAAIALAPLASADPQRGGPGWYGNNGPCNVNDTSDKLSDDGRVMVTVFGPQGCNPALTMYTGSKVRG